MKKITLSALALVIAAFFGMVQFGAPTAFARSSAVPQMGQNQQSPHVKLPAKPGMAPYQRAQVFLGTITRQNGHYVLTAGQMVYKLNDQAKMKKYNGKQVQITGKLNPKTNKITVMKIRKPSY